MLVCTKTAELLGCLSNKNSTIRLAKVCCNWLLTSHCPLSLGLGTSGAGKDPYFQNSGNLLDGMSKRLNLPMSVFPTAIFSSSHVLLGE